MTKDRRKLDIITFKVDDSLREALDGITNRSEFIRNAVLAALEHKCPLCHGTGILSPNQRRHWEKLRDSHPLAKCGDCQEFHLICRHGEVISSDYSSAQCDDETGESGKGTEK